MIDDVLAAVYFQHVTAISLGLETMLRLMSRVSFNQNSEGVGRKKPKQGAKRQ